MEKVTERMVDELGRIVIPADIRSKLGITDKTKLGIYLDDDSIVLAKVVPVCRLCGSTEGYCDDLRICDVCRERIKNS